MSLLDGCFTLDAVGMDFTEEMCSDVLFCKEHGSGSVRITASYLYLGFTCGSSFAGFFSRNEKEV